MVSLTPSSLIIMVNVARQGKYMAKTTLATIDWCMVKFKGKSIPTAMSLRKKAHH